MVRGERKGGRKLINMGKTNFQVEIERDQRRLREIYDKIYSLEPEVSP